MQTAFHASLCYLFMCSLPLVGKHNTILYFAIVLINVFYCDTAKLIKEQHHRMWISFAVIKKHPIITARQADASLKGLLAYSLKEFCDSSEFLMITR